MARKAVLLMGPTASGKSALAVELAARLPCEIVSVDSALIYRGMDIGAAKPPAALRERLPHHLIDIRDPAQAYSAGEFVRDALAAMESIWARGRLPLLVGGTMMYFHALTRGLADLPQSDPAIRADIDAQAARRGWAALHAELAGVDPAAAARIHPNDPQRIQRALEVFRISGTPLTRLQQMRAPALAAVEWIEYAYAPGARAQLHAAIGRRFAQMMADGFLEEVRRLRDRGDLNPALASMRAVGYRQLWRHLDGELPLAEAIERGVIATRQLAKRQWTWLRNRPAARWVDATRADAADWVFYDLEAHV